MGLKNSDIRAITGLSVNEIKTCLVQKNLITLEGKRHFYFNDKELDGLYLVHAWNGAIWKHEAKEYLLSICKECRKLLNININIETTFVEPHELPFIREKKYTIDIIRVRNYMVFKSELGLFKTKKLGKDIEEGLHFLTMHEKTTTLEKI